MGCYGVTAYTNLVLAISVKENSDGAVLPRNLRLRSVVMTKLTSLAENNFALASPLSLNTEIGFH